jgi:hypothetical protein
LPRVIKFLEQQIHPVVRLFQANHRKGANADEKSEREGKYHERRSNTELGQLSDATSSGFVTQ